MHDRVKVRLKVQDPEYFIKTLVGSHIELYWIEKKDKELEFIINKEDYKKLLKNKTIKKMRVIHYYGISKIKYRIKKYGFLILFLIFGVFLNMILSHIILKVEVETPNQNLKEEVRKDLKEFGIKPFHWKVSYTKKEQIKSKLLEKEKKTPLILEGQ